MERLERKKKVLEEQSYVDWAFKTSFLNVRNNFRELTETKTYTTGADTYVEEYIKEVKPFHTKLREYKVGYRKLEVDDGLFTDFDNPPFYDSTTGKIRNLDPGSVADSTRIIFTGKGADVIPSLEKLKIPILYFDL